jgi:hypothetical protein
MFRCDYEYPQCKSSRSTKSPIVRDFFGSAAVWIAPVEGQTILLPISPEALGRGRQGKGIPLMIGKMYGLTGMALK